MNHIWEFEAIGTRWQISTTRQLNDATTAQVQSHIEAFDATWSRFRPDSAIAELSRGTGVDLGHRAGDLIAWYDLLYERTAGAVSPLVGGPLSDLGYDADYSLLPADTIRSTPHWPDRTWDGTQLTIPVGAILDIGAAGKGRLVDEVAAIIGEPCCVDAGGDLLNLTGQTMRVALEDPHHAEFAIGTADVEHGHALCGSATNRRRWGEGLHHVLDARTGRPAHGIAATWVLADSAMVADGLTTALFFASASDIEDVAPFSSIVFTEARRATGHRWKGQIFR